MQVVVKRIERGLKDEEAGRGHLCWTKISVNGWCLVSGVCVCACKCVLMGSEKQSGKEVKTDEPWWCVCVFLVKKTGRNLICYCVSSSLSSS